jgi:hypothetical protein
MLQLQRAGTIHVGKLCYLPKRTGSGRKQHETEKAQTREFKIAEANINHLSWLATWRHKAPIEQKEAKHGRRIDPASLEGRSIIEELRARYSDHRSITAPSTMAA